MKPLKRLALMLAMACRPDAPANRCKSCGTQLQSGIIFCTRCRTDRGW